MAEKKTRRRVSRGGVQKDENAYRRRGSKKGMLRGVKREKDSKRSRASGVA